MHIVSLCETLLVVSTAVVFIAFFNFTLSIRYFNHVGFMINAFQELDREA
jgi:hypothetical protein